MADYEMVGLVSVIIPTYKRSVMLGRAIDSVLNQTYNSVEVIVVDDNSEGDDYRIATSKLMQRYLSNPKVRYITHVKNQNGSAARNTGIINARGEFIAFLDDDDYFLETRIETAINFLKDAESDYGGVCVGYIKKNKNRVYKVGNLGGDYANCYPLLSGRSDYAAGSTLLCRRIVFEKVGLFDISFKRHQDWEFLIRFFRHYKLKVLDKIEVVICSDGIRNTPKSNVLLEMKLQLFRLFESDLDKLGDNCKKEILQYQWKEMVCNYLKEKCYMKAWLLGRENLSISYISFWDLLNFFRAFICGILPLSMSLLYVIYNFKYRKIYRQIS